MSLNPKLIGNKWETDVFPFLLCNMGGKEKKDELMNFVMYKNNSIVLLIKDNLLPDIMIQNLPNFFFNTNFGQRQNKGFGSYTVTKLLKDDVLLEIDPDKLNPLKVLPSKTPLMKFCLTEFYELDKQFQLFSVLDFYWKCLKSGINYTKRIVGKDDVTYKNEERYIKSFLYTYLNTYKGKTWEKRLIKQSFGLETPLPNRNICENNNEVIFGRAMLGCPNFFEYRVPQGKLDEFSSKRKELTKEYRVLIKNKEIERIPTPIIFKPVITTKKDTKKTETIVSVFILVDNDIYTSIEKSNNKTFEFTLEEKNGKDYIPTGKNLNIKISPSDIDYLDLIRKFHSFIYSNKEMANAIFGKEVKQDDRKFKMLARNFQWENILEGNNLVSFYQI